MRARLHVLIVLQCVVFGASCAVLLTFSVFILFFFSRTTQDVWFSLRILSVFFFVRLHCCVVLVGWPIRFWLFPSLQYDNSAIYVQ